MKKHLLLLPGLLLFFTNSYGQTYLHKDDGSGNAVPSVVYEDAAGLIGIGTTTPAADLHISSTNTTDVLSLTDNTTAVPKQLLVVNSSGNIGIGISTPQVLLHIKHHGFSTTSDPMDNPLLVMENDNDETIMAIGNTSDANGNNGAIMMIRSRANYSPNPSDIVPAFAVMNAEDEVLNFVVGGDGTVGLGLDVSNNTNYVAESQFNIRHLGNHDYVMNVTNNAVDVKLFSIRNTGEVGIGIAGTTNSALTLFKDGGNTQLDLRASGMGRTNGIRFMDENNAVRRLITEANGDMVIVPGVTSTGANNLLRVGGSMMVGNGIGNQPALSTMAIQGNAFTVFDICEANNIGSIRWLNTLQEPKHQIFNNNNTQSLVIDPGYDGNATDLLEVRGDLEVVGDLTVGGAWHFNSKVTIGNVTAPNDYMLYVEKGIMTEKAKIAVKTTGDWSDFVFDKNYKLPTLQEVEAFIAQNKHLPGVPSADEVVCDGIDVGKMDAKLLQKIEELTLYMLELQKQNEEQQKLINELVEAGKKQ